MANIDLKNNDYDGQTIVAVQYGHLSGFVGPAGDFDGDGFDDLLLRSYYRHEGIKQEIEVWLGGPAPLERGFVFSGDPANDHNFADVLSAIGDINGDGFDDIIGGDDHGGQITVYLGRPSGSEGSSFDILGTQLYRMDFAPAGDINADGLDDFIIGMPYGDDGGDNVGQAYVILGRAEGHGQIDLSNLPADQGFEIVGAASGRGTGFTVAEAGDVNDDGFDDIIVGTYAGYLGSGDAPQAHVIFGKAGGFGSIDLDELDPADGFAIIGKPEQNAGSQLAAAGDVNGDGIDDFIVGGPSRAFIIYGKSEGLGTVDLTALAPADGYRIAFNGDLRSLTSAGDINGDGLDDIILAVNIFPIGRASFVIYGQAGRSQTVELANLDPERGFSLRGDNGYNAAGVGDLNGDGFGDIAVTGHRDVHVIYGGARFNPVAFTGTDADDVAAGGIRGDELQGGGGNDVLTGRQGHDVIRGGDGDDVLSGGGDDDLIDGGAGSDTADYSLSLGRIHVDLTSGLQNGGGADGIDTLVSIENVIGSSAGSIIIGDGASNRLTGGNAVDRIQGGGGGDLLDGGGSTYDMVDYSWAGIGVRVALDEAGPQDTNAGIDTLTGFENLTGSDFNDVLGGDEGHNRLDGGKGDDRLRGNAGYDTLIGGEGSDTAVYFGSAAGVTVSLNQTEQQTGGAGNDYLYEIENLIGSVHADRLIGNAGVNLLDGGEGDDALDSGGGGGRMIGRGGDDRYTVRHVDDVVVEAAGAGTELVISRIESYTLAANVEDLVLEDRAWMGIGNGLDNYIRGSTGENHLEGGGGDDLINGRGGDDTIDGGAGDDILIGLGGSDIMAGGLGNDLFYVTEEADVVGEIAGGGIDTVSSRIDYRLGVNVENLVLTAGISGIGNELANSIVGNNGHNIIDGGGGADRMSGALGDDLYHVDDAADLVIERAAGGTDTVRSSASYVLGGNVENLILTDAAANGTGNALGNSITGNDLANRLDGGAGADLLRGGGGDDLYDIDHSGDLAVEGLGAGFDTVRSSVSYTLGENIETLLLTGSAAINGTGNALSNRILGNDGDNRLAGGGRADELIGAGGDDQLSGGDAIDRLLGGLGYDRISGDAGSDLIEGGQGNDSLSGGSENDSLHGGADRDRLTGGAGRDAFYFDTALDPVVNVDVISDFIAADDTIMLDRAIFDAIAADGRLASSAFHAGAAAADANDRIIYNAANGSLYYDADGSGAAAQILFARVTAGTSMGYADFVAYSDPPAGV